MYIPSSIRAFVLAYYWIAIFITDVGTAIFIAIAGYSFFKGDMRMAMGGVFISSLFGFLLWRVIQRHRVSIYLRNDTDWLTIHDHESRYKKRPIMNLSEIPCGRLMVGNIFVVLWIVLSLFMWQMPWEWLYSLGWYRSFIEYMGSFTYSIQHLPQSKSQFVEYAQAYIALVNLVGPFYLLKALHCGFQYANRKDVLERNYDIPMRTFVNYLLLGIFGAMLGFVGTQFFLGQSDSVFSGYLYHSKLGFILMHLGMWWVTGAGLMAVITTSLLVFNRLTWNNKGR